MYSGFYSAASGMLMQQRNLNVLSNNLANVKTPGYRTQRLISTTFRQEFLTRVEGNSSAVIGGSNPIKILDEVESLFGAGILEDTEMPYDLALAGEGYFNIDGTDNRYLTRNGSFTVDEEGYLTLEGVGRVLGEDGQLLIGGSGYAVGIDGSVFDNKGNYVDTILITSPADGVTMEKAANGLYIGTGVAMNPKAETTGVIQFALEKANVDMNRELSMIIQAQRNFQACSVILKGIDQINQKAANQIASL